MVSYNFIQRLKAQLISRKVGAKIVCAPVKDFYNSGEIPANISEGCN
jgi:hypothetical protein